MKNNETGEFELVVGDRHLLVAFFIVVLLCGVAFAMGYVVGQNVPHSGKATAESIPPTVSPGATAETRPQPLPPAPAPTATAPAPGDGGEKPADSSPQPTTQPAQEPQPQAPAASTPGAPPAVSSSAAGLVAPEALPSGNFWQVLAVAQPQAEAVRTTLKDHNFTVILSPGPKGLTRVLVGPYPDTQSLGKAKTDLENAGFRPVRYKP